MIARRLQVIHPPHRSPNAPELHVGPVLQGLDAAGLRGPFRAIVRRPDSSTLTVRGHWAETRGYGRGPTHDDEPFTFAVIEGDVASEEIPVGSELWIEGDT